MTHYAFYYPFISDTIDTHTLNKLTRKQIFTYYMFTKWRLTISNGNDLFFYNNSKYMCHIIDVYSYINVVGCS